MLIKPLNSRVTVEKWDNKKNKKKEIKKVDDVKDESKVSQQGDKNLPEGSGGKLDITI
jgi:hypothetical protein